jgi:hypothetical protein
MRVRLLPADVAKVGQPKRPCMLSNRSGLQMKKVIVYSLRRKEGPPKGERRGRKQTFDKARQTRTAFHSRGAARFQQVQSQWEHIQSFCPWVTHHSVLMGVQSHRKGRLRIS